MIQDFANYDGIKLTATLHYGEDNKPESFELRTVQYDDPAVAYWLAANGKTYAFAVKQGATCIANVQRIFCLAMAIPDRGIAADGVYCIWAPKNKAPSVWKRWDKKWSARTAPIGGAQ